MKRGPEKVYMSRARKDAYDFTIIENTMREKGIWHRDLYRRIKEKYSKYFTEIGISDELLTKMIDKRLVIRQRDKYYFSHKIMNETNFRNRLSEGGIDNMDGDVDTIILKWKECLVIQEREVYTILNGKRTFPNEIYLSQIVGVLGLTMEDIERKDE